MQMMDLILYIYIYYTLYPIYLPRVCCPVLVLYCAVGFLSQTLSLQSAEDPLIETLVGSAV